MKTMQIGVSSLIAVMILIAVIGLVYADTGVPAVPEVQGLVTGTSSNVVGTVTETDSGAWTTTNDPLVMYTFTLNDNPHSPQQTGTGLLTWTAALQSQLQSAGGSLVFDPTGSYVVQVSIPQSLSNTQIVGLPGNVTWGQILALFEGDPFITTTTSYGGIHTGVLDPGQVQYTAGYNDQYAGISGQQTFAKSMAISTGNTIADQSNIKANTNIQYIAVDTGRATRTEDLLLDGASQAQNSSSLILCPFDNANPG